MTAADCLHIAGDNNGTRMPVRALPCSRLAVRVSLIAGGRALALTLTVYLHGATAVRAENIVVRYRVVR